MKWDVSEARPKWQSSSEALIAHAMGTCHTVTSYSLLRFQVATRRHGRCFPLEAREVRSIPQGAEHGKAPLLRAVLALPHKAHHRAVCTGTAHLAHR